MREYIVGIENEHSHALDVCYKRELIRCKDCKYSVDEYDDGECYCDYEKDLRYIKDWGHYCSWAERKEE